MLGQHSTEAEMTADLELISSDGAVIVSVNALEQLAQAADLF